MYQTPEQVQGQYVRLRLEAYFNILLDEWVDVWAAAHSVSIYNKSKKDPAEWTALHS